MKAFITFITFRLAHYNIHASEDSSQVCFDVASLKRKARNLFASGTGSN